jgi:CRISPR-associated protein Csb2
MLTIECQYLTGVAVASSVADRSQPEWPPHPSRLFSALVAAWGAGGCNQVEREALAALEALDAPEVHAPDAAERSIAEHFVPPNDDGVGKGARLADSAIRLLPERRRRQQRTFPAVVLPAEDHGVAFVWPRATLHDEYVRALHDIAARTTSLGHSRSLVRTTVREGLPVLAETRRRWLPQPSGERVFRVPTAGRLAELQALYNAGLRPTLGAARRYGEADDSPHRPPTSYFDPNWIVLAHAGGVMPSLESWPYMAWVLRRALIACVERFASRNALTPQERSLLMRIVSGHSDDGAASRDVHAAFVPMANVGFGTYSSGALMGTAIVLPRETPHIVHEILLTAISSAMLKHESAISSDQLAFGLALGTLGFCLLAPGQDGPPQSLSPLRFSQRSRMWTSATPIVLDRFPRVDGDAEATIAAACEHIGLPRPEQVLTHKHSACAGAPASRPRIMRVGAPGAWLTSWRDGSDVETARFGNRILVHATIRFSEPVMGPVLVGAGRFYGLGLCLPAAEAPRE